MLDDTELLRRYATARAEADFAELVRRQVNFVYSAALRQVNGDAHLAQDVTQLVFTDLARKAGQVAEYRVLAGWLFTSTRFAAAKLIRGERRRQAREAEAQLMDELTRDPAAQLDWARVRPVLDEVIGELSEADREAVLLRFFEGRDFATVGAKLRLTENAARMRVERALDKLHAQLTRRGVTSTTAALAAALGGQAVAAAPAGLAATVTGAALAGGGSAAVGAAAGTGVWATFMAMNKLTIGISGALAIAGVTGFALQARTNAALGEEVAGLRQQNAALAALKTENAALSRTAAEAAELRGDDAALARLNDEAAALRLRQQKVAQAEQASGRRGAWEVTLAGTQMDRQPRPVNQTRPVYPAALRQSGVGGEVVVDFIVDQKGDVQNAFATSSKLMGKTVRTSTAKGEAGHLEVFTVAGEKGDNGAKLDPTASINEQNVAESAQLFEAAAVAAVKQWKFAAGAKGGRLVNTRLQVPIVFTVPEGDGGAGAGSPKNGP